MWIKVFVKAPPTAADSPINCNLSLRLSAVDRLRLLVIFKAKQNKRLIWFDLLLTYTLVITVKMFAHKKTFVAIVLLNTIIWCIFET